MFPQRFRQQAVPVPAPTPQAFVLCPVPWLQVLAPGCWPWQLAVYQQALAEAEAVVRPGLPERDLLGVWN